mmetsp:Transcript_16451/g.57497  ORF Transcript_16451/g.57497 Transcript_16451/m.57497 type:complete len:532 (-) Transcript_16451:2877-4472(-)
MLAPQRVHSASAAAELSSSPSCTATHRRLVSRESSSRRAPPSVTGLPPAPPASAPAAAAALLPRSSVLRACRHVARTAASADSNPASPSRGSASNGAIGTSQALASRHTALKTAAGDGDARGATALNLSNTCTMPDRSARCAVVSARATACAVTVLAVATSPTRPRRTLASLPAVAAVEKTAPTDDRAEAASAATSSRFTSGPPSGASSPTIGAGSVACAARIWSAGSSTACGIVVLLVNAARSAGNSTCIDVAGRCVVTPLSLSDATISGASSWNRRRKTAAKECSFFASTCTISRARVSVCATDGIGHAAALATTSMTSNTCVATARALNTGCKCRTIVGSSGRTARFLAPEKARTAASVATRRLRSTVTRFRVSSCSAIFLASLSSTLGAALPPPRAPAPLVLFFALISARTLAAHAASSRPPTFLLSTALATYTPSSGGGSHSVPAGVARMTSSSGESAATSAPSLSSDAVRSGSTCVAANERIPSMAMAARSASLIVAAAPTPLISDATARHAPSRKTSMSLQMPS